ncbi:MAG: GAF and ANTAR domain-containing protein [Actinomycetota bacterium]|nr:GAF and ANTAR domain-containing protein [Actinomycetota bacterium]
MSAPCNPRDPGIDVDVEGLLHLDETQFNALNVLSRALHVKEADLPKTLDAILRSATSVVEGAAHSGLNLLVRDRFEPQATVGSAPPELDELQKRTGIGPCIDASRDQAVVTVGDMAAESRWPNFVAAATGLGISSMLCVPLWVDDRRLGSLSLYGESPEVFGDGAKRLAELYATHAAIALADALRTEQLRRAMASRDVIGQAKGVLMERHRITSEEAFEMLKQVSRQVDRKVVDIAESLTLSGALPQPPD